MWIINEIHRITLRQAQDLFGITGYTISLLQSTAFIQAETYSGKLIKRMKQTRLIMGMPITIELVNSNINEAHINDVFSYFSYIDDTFSTYKSTSEISKINNGLLLKKEYSKDMQIVFELSEQTRIETQGYFNIRHKGKYDPSGIVKGWAIYQASILLKKRGLKHFYVEAGGDIQVSGKNTENKNWTVGIRNPFNRREIVKKLSLSTEGIATSGTYIRGQHIYNPHNDNNLTEIVSLTVIGPNIYEADRFATAAFAMGRKGIAFIEKLPGLEGYMIDNTGIATYTSNFNTKCINLI